MSVEVHPTVRSGRRGAKVGARPRASAWLVLGSLAAGAAVAALLVLLVLPGATESVVTGSLLIGSGVGWALLAHLAARSTGGPQGWVRVPAVVMTVTGALLVLLAPSDAALTALGWAWPPGLLALVAWTSVRMRPALTRPGRRLLGGVLAVLAVAAVGGVVQDISAVRTGRAHPAPGARYDVGGHRLHVDCRGEGGPTVVLINGMGEFSASWARVLDGVSASTRVCAYDRAGQGWSDDVPRPQDGAEAARDLHALLAAAGEPGPFVLVGHSTGGPYAMAYAAEHPEQVAGMVLLDSSTPHQFTALPAYPSQYAVMRRGLALLPTLARLGLGPVLAGSHLPPADAAVVDAVAATPRAARNTRDEVSVLPRVLEQARALDTLGDRPLAVLTSAQTLRGTEGWGDAQDRMAALSTVAVHGVVDASHAGVVEDRHGAAASVAAITSVVAAVRTGDPVRPW